MWWKKKKNAHERIEKIKEILQDFDFDLKKIFNQLDILEQKFKSKWFPKKKQNIEDISKDCEENKEEAGDENKPKDLIDKMFLPSERGING